MPQINSFGVRDLRSFGNKKSSIPIKPINILVGRNSCGKSTFLRAFPLLRQSIQANTKSPILWFGDLVDFGDFDTALRDGQNTISFEFETILEVKDEDDFWEYEFIDADYMASNRDYLFPAKITISISRKNETTLRTKLIFNIHCAVIEIVYSGDEVEWVTARPANGDIEYFFEVKMITSHGSLFPTVLRGLREIKSKDFKGIKYAITNPLSTDPLNLITDLLETYHHGSKGRQKIKDAVDKIPLSYGEKLINNLKKAFPKDKHFNKNLEHFEDTIHDVSFTLLLVRSFQDILKSADSLFSQFYSGVKYQAPLRAAGERFYRYQDLRVDEVDHTGSNLPMVINSLDAYWQEELSNWILENFGFELSLNASGLHYELLIKEQDDKEFHNISDMGFGYSQILPVIVSIWLECIAGIRNKNSAIQRRKGPRIIVLEQPELHLHPALQYKFGLAISKVIAQSGKSDIYFVIETHSKHLIDAIGESIRTGLIEKDAVNISLFEKKENGITDTTVSGFDEGGYLLDWPIGFLSPDYDY